MAIFRSTYSPVRLAAALFILLLVALFLLPRQSQGLLQYLGGPLGYVLSVPLEALAAVDRGLGEVWEGYVDLRQVHEENRRLRQEIEFLQGQNNQLRETAAAAQRLEGLLGFKEKIAPATVAAEVIGRDATNWYRAIILNKGERHGVGRDMGVITPAGVVGRVVKTTSSSAVVLLITDANNAIPGLIQRTRDEGIVEGTHFGQARVKYVPLLSTLQIGDRVVTSGLTGGFPRGLSMGLVTRIEKKEGDLFQSAEIEPEVDVTKVEEVLVITAPYEMEQGVQELLRSTTGETHKP